MKLSLQHLNSLYLCLALPLAPMVPVVCAEELDDLLAPKEAGEKYVDDSATEAWNGVVDAFRRNDLAKAKELGVAFLAGKFKTSPYQVLGVQVMMDLANAENPTVTRDVGLTGEMKRLMSERDALRTKYANLQRVIQNAEARINKLTNNRTQPVQAGTQAFRECARASAEIQAASAEMEAMKPQIEANKLKVGKVEVGVNQNLKSDTIKLLDMLIEANEIEAAFAIANVFTRVVGSDLDVAKKQQDVIRLREDQMKATKIVAAITAEVESLLTLGKGEEAEGKYETLVAKVESSSQSESVKKMTLMKLKPVALRIAAAKKGEAVRNEREQMAQQEARREEEERAANAKSERLAATAEINERLKVLEEKLDAAQASFGTVIRSIAGFAEYTGEFSAQSEKEKMAATLREKIKTGQVSKEKVDNMVKAKAEHMGIIREVEVIRSDASQLSVVQRGRLANLHATAQTALDLLKGATP